MRVALLVTAAMKAEQPNSLNVLDDWGFVGIRDPESGKPLAHGTHMYLEGEESDFVRWLASHDAVWITKSGTSPQFQQFEAVHVSAEAIEKTQNT